MKALTFVSFVAALAAAPFAALAQAPAAPPATFGSPPSGAVPILYNDRHVYATPDTLRSGRVLAALVKDGQILVPLRSMFAQMGAEVSYDAKTRTATVVRKPDVTLSLTLDKPEMVLNGQARPLDVPPAMYQGTIVVPIRVISEAFGAYVQWLPDKREVVVRYVPSVPAPAPATPMPAAPSAPAPVATSPPPTPTPKPYREVVYLAGDYLISPKIYNEFAPGVQANGSWSARGAAEFSAFDRLPMMFEIDYKNWRYPHNCGVAQATATTANAPQCFVTAIGGRFATYVPDFTAVNRDADVRLGLRVLNPRVFVAIGYIWGSNNYGYPNMSAVGVGLEKMPDLDNKLAAYGSVFYYPNFRGTYSNGAINTGPTSYGIGYNLLKYQVGVNYDVFGPVFVDLGWTGENGANKNNAPISFSFNGPYAGFVLRISQ